MLSFTTQKKNYSTCIKDLSVRPVAIKLIEQNIGRKLLDMSLGNDILEIIFKHKWQNKK